MGLIKRDIDRLIKVDPAMVILFYEVQKRTKHDIHVGYLGGWRSEAIQNSLYRKNKSSKDGYSKRSKHQDGLAVDFVVYQGGTAVWYADLYEDVWFTFEAVARELGLNIRWGGDWNMNGIRVDKDKNEKFLDAGHVELM